MQGALGRGDVQSGLRMPRAFGNVGMPTEQRRQMELQEGTLRRQMATLRQTGIGTGFQWSNILTPLFWLSLPVLRET
eukprot:12695960-Alexandrium_andersonii.AAC.1